MCFQLCNYMPLKIVIPMGVGSNVCLFFGPWKSLSFWDLDF